MTAHLTRQWLAALLLITLAARLPAADKALPAGEPTAEGREFFEKRIRPLLVRHCYSCHSAEAEKLRGGLRLDTRAGIQKGGKSGPAVVPGSPEKSLLLQAVRNENEAERMPPKGKLAAAEIEDLETWIKRGAPDPRTDSVKVQPVDLTGAKDFWCFRPVKDPPPPRVKGAGWPINDVDRFILAGLEARKLHPAPAADRRTLIRRATYDLTGLPPSPEEIDAFLKDDSPVAFAKVIDRLLASSAYGERWGRHWLDVVRYADTAGDNSDYPIPQMYRYRDWVIRAFNRDVPYDQFIREQMAGDLLPAQDEADRQEKIIATGYLANSRRFGSYEDARYPWNLTIDDTIDNLGRTFLALTINCARCHDHKFDPVTQQDYYALYGFFQSTRYPWPGIELDKAQHDLVPLAPPEKVAALDRERREKLAAFDEHIKKLEAEKAEAVKALAETEKVKDEAERKTRITEANQRVGEKDRAVRAAKLERENFARKPLPFDLAYAVAEGRNEGKKKVGNAHVQIKGDPERPGEEVPRRFPIILGGQALPKETKGSGRLELAKWIADPANPLTARVMVNRIWQYHFGRGIVPTPSDFGKQGRPPTHPELLDYLATQLMADGGKDAPAWGIKKMHRLIMLSRTYQMSSEEDADNARIDVNNDSLWRFRRHRLDAEAIRDTMLVVAGNLDTSPSGPHPFPEQAKWDFTQHKPFKAVYDSNRRSVYLMTQRIQRHPFLALFDGPDTNAGTAVRTTSTTPLQALFLMNDPFVHEQARKFAVRMLREKSDDAGRIELAYLLLFGRAPAAEERDMARGYLAKVGERLASAGVPVEQRPAKAWESLARALFLSNEFVYID